MKSQLLYIFVLAAPLLVQLLSREPKVAPVESEPAAAIETKSAPDAGPDSTRRPARAPMPKSAEKPKPAAPAELPAAHAFTFM